MAVRLLEDLRRAGATEAGETDAQRHRRESARRGPAVHKRGCEVVEIDPARLRCGIRGHQTVAVWLAREAAIHAVNADSLQARLPRSEQPIQDAAALFILAHLMPLPNSMPTGLRLTIVKRTACMPAMASCLITKARCAGKPL